MAITFRGIKGSPLTITELDNNFRDFYYSASYNNSELILYKSASGDTGLTIPFDTPKGPEYAIQIKKGDVNASGSNVYVTGSKNFKFDFNQNILDVSGSANVTGNLVVGGSVTAEEFITERNITIKLEKSGSTKFGDSDDDVHSFTGTLLVTGSVSGSDSIHSTSITGSNILIDGVATIGDLTLTGLSTSSELTALSIGGSNIVSTTELGSTALLSNLTSTTLDLDDNEYLATTLTAGQLTFYNNDTTIEVNDTIGKIQFYGRDDYASLPGAYDVGNISLVAAGEYGSAIAESKLTVNLRPQGSGGPITEVLALTNSGSAMSSPMIFNDDVTVAGNLTVQGDQITANVGTLQIEDKLVEIGRNNTQSSLADGGGIFISGANASLTWDHTNSYLYTNKDLKVNGRLRTAYLTFPAETGEVAEVLHSDGAGNLYFATASGGGGGGGGGLIQSFTNATTAGRVVTSVDAQNINAEAGLTFISGTLSIGDTDLREYTSADTDVVGLIGGTNFGTILESDANSHIVMGIRDNDANDSFSIVTGNGGYYTGNAYTKLAFQVKGSGATTTGGNLAVSGSITATGDITAYASSDEQLKDNVELISEPISKIKQIKGVSFDWNDKSDFTGRDIGVIAQDIEKVLPELVRENTNGYKAVRYEKIVALLIEAVKEQQSQIDDLKLDLLKSRS